MGKTSRIHGGAKMPKMQMVNLLIPEPYLAMLADLVREGVYPNRSEAIRMAIRDMVKKDDMILRWMKRMRKTKKP